MHPQDNSGRSESSARLAGRVPLRLPIEQVTILRGDFLSWLGGIDDDLNSSARLRDPEATVREGEALRRLLLALDANEIELPDEEARRVLDRAARGFDQASGYEEIAATHDAHRVLLEVLDEGRGR
jgi:hypothetical protein